MCRKTEKGKENNNKYNEIEIYKFIVDVNLKTENKLFDDGVVAFSKLYVYVK